MPCNRHIILPDSTGHAAIDAALDAYTNLNQQHTDALADVSRLEDERDRAERADVATYAAALAAGKKDPRGHEAVDTVNVQLKTANRLVEALEEALGLALETIDETIREHSDEFIADLDQRTAEHRDQIAALVDLVETSHAEIAHASSLRRWAKKFPANYNTMTLRLPGTETTVAAVLRGLRELATRATPADPREVQHRLTIALADAAIRRAEGALERSSESRDQLQAVIDAGEVSDEELEISKARIPSMDRHIEQIQKELTKARTARAALGPIEPSPVTTDPDVAGDELPTDDDIEAAAA